MLFHLFVALTGLLALRFTISPLKMAYYDILSNGKLFERVFTATPLDWLYQFSNLITRGPPTLRQKFSRLIGSFESDERLSLNILIICQTIHGISDEELFRGQDLVYDFGSNSSDVDRKRLANLAFFPKIRSNHLKSYEWLVHGLPFASWGDIVELEIPSYRLLSSRILCSALSNRKIVLENDENVWQLVDGECFRGLTDIKQVRAMAKRLLKPCYLELGGVGPLVRAIQLIVALKYLEIGMSSPTFDGTLESVRGMALTCFYEFELGLVHAKNVPEGSLRRLYSGMFDGLRGQVKFPNRAYTGSADLLELISFLKGLPATIETVRARLNCLSLLATCSSDGRALIDETEALFKSTQFYNIPRRDVYALFIIISVSPNLQAYTALRRLLWSHLIDSVADLHDVLAVNRSNFGLVAEYVIDRHPAELRKFVSWDILGRVKYHDMRVLLSSNEELKLAFDSAITAEQISASLIQLLDHHFIPLDWVGERRVYTPRLQLHPFPETVFWQLLWLGLTFDLTFDFLLHPLYLQYTLARTGPLRERGLPEFVAHVVDRQFYQGDPQASHATQVYELDMLQMSQSYHRHIIGNSRYDYMICQGLTSSQLGRGDSHYAKEWRRLAQAGSCEALRPKLEFLGECVWRERQAVLWYSDLLAHLSPTHFSRLVFSG